MDDLWATKSKDVGLIDCAINFQDESADSCEHEAWSAHGIYEDVGATVAIVEWAGIIMSVPTTPLRVPSYGMSGLLIHVWSQRGVTPAEDHPIEATRFVAVGEPPTEPEGFLSAISQRLLPSFVHSGWAEDVPVTVGVATSSWTFATMHLTEVNTHRTAYLAAIWSPDLDMWYWSVLAPGPTYLLFAEGCHSQSLSGLALPGSH